MVATAAPGLDIIQHIRQHQDPARYQDLHWEGTFVDYLSLVYENPRIARNAFQRMYDMILSFGVERYTEYKKEIIALQLLRRPDRTAEGTRSSALDIPLDEARRRDQGRGQGYGTGAARAAACTDRSAPRNPRSPGC